ncbi:MAG: 30S ribosomal protein S12 methylthiotransferase RimO, partial [Firmicutes bacterium]|nr:30S ribosomal protein S12 methylthiotransferase RimO [Bacillota bacterium]
MKLYIETLGCPKNFNDSEGIGGIWEKAGMYLTDDPIDADAILVNTCGFINDAKTESIEKIFDMARIKEEAAADPEITDKILIVSGCLSQRYGEDLYEEIPEVDIFLGVNDYERLPQMVKGLAKGTRAKAFSCEPEAFEEFSARKLAENPYSATLRIAEGCNNRCAYCVIPQIRGKLRSRPMESILEEAKVMAENGCKEMMLIAQDVTEYGRDLYGELRLPELLRELCKVEGIRWIRLMYCYEDKITDELIEVMASEEKICHYIDIPLQHIADGVLSRMNRRSTTASIKDTIGRLRTAMPDIHIRTTMIVGFPAETEEEFDELLDFVEETRFERLGVFAYSREEGTVAGDMENQIVEDVKAQRVDAVMRRQLDISREIN